MKRSERNLRAFFFACRPWEGSRAFVVSAAFGAGFLSVCFIFAKCPGEHSSGRFLLNDDDSVEGELKFHPAFPVSKLRVCLTWEKAKQKGLFDQNTEA